jgi:hypothetical protein
MNNHKEIKMFKKISGQIILILMLLNGIFFISNIIVIGNTEAAIEMHEDLSPVAGPIMANSKVIITFVGGLLYIIAAIGIFKKKYNLALCGFIAFILFFLFYIIELLSWGNTHTPVWIGFSIFGTLSLIYGIFSWSNWKSRKTKNLKG